MCSSLDEPCIAISPTEAQCDTHQQFPGSSGQPVCTITIPNQLLLEWNDTDRSITFVSKANNHIARDHNSQTHREAGEAFGSTC